MGGDGSKTVCEGAAQTMGQRDCTDRHSLLAWAAACTQLGQRYLSTAPARVNSAPQGGNDISPAALAFQSM